VPALFQPSPILQVQRLSWRLSKPKHAGEGHRLPLSLATAFASVDADCVNGAAIRGTPRS
jgi:hypothetical protein